MSPATGADGPAPQVRMRPATAVLDGQSWRYAVSDNEVDGDVPVWALNLHGYLAGGGMYWRESTRLAAALGWRVVTPSLPGFGGSDPLPWQQLSMRALAEGLAALLDHLGARRAVILGHSMGGAIAVRFGADHPERTLGIIYRDGAATPSWKHRRGLPVSLLSPISPDLAALLDLLGAAVLDLPDLAFGRLRSTIGGLLPDARRNLRSIGQTIPTGALLFSCDLRAEVAELARDPRIPVLTVWGRFDRLAPPATAHEFSELANEPVVWVAGGHSWMLARPGIQARILGQHALGRAFHEKITQRHRYPTPSSSVGGLTEARIRDQHVPPD